MEVFAQYGLALQQLEVIERPDRPTPNLRAVFG